MGVPPASLCTYFKAADTGASTILVRNIRICRTEGLSEGS
jgi:hypothetical protein